MYIYIYTEREREREERERARARERDHFINVASGTWDSKGLTLCLPDIASAKVLALCVPDENDIHR